MRALAVRLMVLLAVLIMPFGMTGAAATTLHSEMAAGMPMGHCPDQPPAREMKGGIAVCAMACAAALPAFDPATQNMPMTMREPAHEEASRQLHGLHPETATPPPRRS